jgi:antitoxin (DNA-binding transcriptional repressor) of toxin-antitoxin stability system
LGRADLEPGVRHCTAISYMLYTGAMAKLAASEFRTRLFDALEAAHQGEEVTVTYKDREYALVEKRKPSKFSYAKTRPGVVTYWKELLEASWNEADWQAKWDRRLDPKGPKRGRS